MIQLVKYMCTRYSTRKPITGTVIDVVVITWKNRLLRFLVLRRVLLALKTRR